MQSKGIDEVSFEVHRWGAKISEKKHLEVIIPCGRNKPSGALISLPHSFMNWNVFRSHKPLQHLLFLIFLTYENKFNNEILFLFCTCGIIKFASHFCVGSAIWRGMYQLDTCSMNSSLQIRHLEEGGGGKATSFSLAIITVKSSLSDSLFEAGSVSICKGPRGRITGRNLVRGRA